MKKGMKFLAIALAAAMVTTSVPVYAAPGTTSSYSSSYSSLKSRWDSFWSRVTGNDDKSDEEEQQPTQNTDETTETDTTVTAPEVNTGDNDSDVSLMLLEDETTVEEGTELRAATYAMDSPSAQANTTTLKYFPVTMYNYDERINNATHQAEVDAALANGGINTLTKWNGIYFGGNDLLANVKNGESYTYSTGGEPSYTETIVNYNNYSSYANNGYYFKTDDAYHLVTGIECSRSWQYPRQYSWTISYDGGKATPTGDSITLYKANNVAMTQVLGYADWNKWVGDFTTNNSTSGNRIYSGLVESKLDAEKNIIFKKTEGGIFDSNDAVKDIYYKVGLPFEYDSETKYYTFDANEFGAYFHQEKGSDSDTIAGDKNLYYNPTPQKQEFRGQDGRGNGWYPYNDSTYVSTTDADYFFGMKATIPFTMTSNGRMNENDKDSDPIVFDFSGDDDVWVFVDGTLVLDIGGVRNMLNGSIDFANNTWSVTKPANQNGGDLGDAAVPAAATSGKLFNDENGSGILNQTRTTFSASDSHELTVFYLERGAGSSNCKIKFNLPMKDTVSVTKRATQSIDDNGEITPLTAAEQTTVNNINFGFTLLKNGIPVSNTNYNLLNASGQVTSTPSTDANGHFILKNGETARFVGEIVADGAEYKVVEDIPNNAVTTDGETRYTFSKAVYSYGGTAASGYIVNNKEYSTGSEIENTEVNIPTVTEIASAAITAKGSDEAEDSLQFICENYFNANLPNPSSRPVDDQIVIDYGLPVVIDVLANDVYRGDKIELTEVTGAQYGTATIENGKITYQLTKQLSGVEVLTYTAKVTGSGNSGSETTTDSESNTAKIYIIPATSMYYEENFRNLVTFFDGKSSGWKVVGKSQIEPQEPGVVGTVADSPYGSDAAYINDGGDSNGSSMYVDTTNGAAGFTYTFTGTATSIFARTTGNTGYIKIEVKQGDTTVLTRFVDTKYVSEEGTEVEDDTLYNIPVFTYEAEEYGTYTMNVSIAKKSVVCGEKFWLDGIRIVNPLDEKDTNVAIAKAAYAADGEANMTNVTLRNKLIANYTVDAEDGSVDWKDDSNFVLFTDSNGTIVKAGDYVSNGPKEEVYLNKDQSVTFSLYDWDADTNKIYLGIKSPAGSGSVDINNNSLNINNASDCYYNITGYADITPDKNGVKIATFTVKATEGLISVTNIKVTGNAEFVICTPEDINTMSLEGDETAPLSLDGEENKEVLEPEKAETENLNSEMDETENVNPDSEKDETESVIENDENISDETVSGEEVSNGDDSEVTDQLAETPENSEVENVGTVSGEISAEEKEAE